LIFFRSNLLKLARGGLALVAGWSRFSLRRSLPRLIPSSPRAFKLSCWTWLTDIDSRDYRRRRVPFTVSLDSPFGPNVSPAALDKMFRAAFTSLSRDYRKRNNQAFCCSVWRTLDGLRISSTSSLFLSDSRAQPTILPKMPCKIFDAQLRRKAKSSIEHDSSVLDRFLCDRGDGCV